MEEINLEQSQIEIAEENQDGTNPDPSVFEQDSKPGYILGKFNSVQELVKAYEEIQSAFTRKSQELANLRNDTASVAEKEVVKQDDAQVQIATQSTTTAESGKSISTEEVIRKYLLSVAAGKIAPTVIAGDGNGFAFSNVAEAKTIHATTRVAETFFKEKKL
jgi:hypothetical protein